MLERKTIMSITFAASTPSSILLRLHTLFDHLSRAVAPQGRLYGNLRDLPDHLLVDIGVDPRRVPTRLEDDLSRPDVFYQSLVVGITHGVAKP
jgi:hypothetical protein